MGVQTSHSRSAEAWGLTRRQHGVVTRRQLLLLGFSPKAIQHRVAKGKLHLLHRCVYAVGRRQVSLEGRWLAAVFACGEGALLSHGSAAALWGFEREESLVEVSVRRGTDSRPANIRVHRRSSLRDEDRRHRNLDLAVALDPRRLERAVNEAHARDLIDLERLRRWLDRHRGEHGVRILRALLDRDEFRLSDSELEVLFRPLARAAGLPPPLTKQWVNGFEVDFFWPRLGLVVETDSLRHHRSAARQARDLLRDQAHTASGLTPLRFNHRQVNYEPAHVRTVLAATARRLGGAGRRASA